MKYGTRDIQELKNSVCLISNKSQNENILNLNVCTVIVKVENLFLSLFFLQYYYI